MKRYITQLIEKLKVAAREHRDLNLSQQKDPNADDFLESEIYIELEDNMEGGESIFGIQQIEFPPAEKLTEEEAGAVYNAMVDLLKCINNEVVLPEIMPLKSKYKLLTDIWDKGFPDFKGTSGTYYHDFCTGSPEDCVLDGWCSCRGFYLDQDFCEEIDEDEEEKKADFIENKYVVQLCNDISNSLDNLPSATTFRILYGEIEEEDQKIGPIKSLGEWLDLAPEIFPLTDSLQPNEMDAISNALMSLFNDEIINSILLRIDSKRRYEQMVKYLTVKFWYNGDGSFQMVPISHDELRKTLDHIDLLNSNILNWKGDTNKSSGSDKSDDELPF